MKKRAISCVLVLMVLCIAAASPAAKVAHVEVLYMNHGPVKPVVSKLKETFSRYGGKIKVSWYDSDTGEGRKFMAAKGFNDHVPVMVWIDGSTSSKLPRGTVQFAGFPAGYGPEQVQGKWTMKDLEAALDQAAARK